MTLLFILATVFLFVFGLAVYARCMANVAAKSTPFEGFDDHEWSALAWATGGPQRVLQLWWVELLAAGAIVPRGTGPKTLFEVPGISVESQDPWIERAAQALLPGAYNRAEISLRLGAPLREFHREALSRGLLVASSFLTPGRLTQGGLQWREEQLAKASVAQRTPQTHTLGWAVAAGGLAVLAATPFEALAAHVHARGAVEGSSSGGCGSATYAGGCGSPAAAVAASSTGFDTGGGFGGGDASSGDGGGGCGGGCGGGGCGS